MRWQDVAKLLTAIIILAGGIGSLVTYTDLFGALFQLTGMKYSHTGDITCSSTCESYININTSYWNIGFEHSSPSQNIYIDIGDGRLTRTSIGEYPETVLYKKWRYGRKLWVNLNNVKNIITTQLVLSDGSTKPYDIEVDWMVPARGKGNWRPLKDGDTWERGKVNRMKLVGHKEPKQTVKWSFEIGNYMDIDPMWNAIGKDMPYTKSNVLQVDMPLQWEITKTGLEKELEVEYDIINDTSTIFCINSNQKYKEDLMLSRKNVSGVPITILNGSMNIGVNSLDFSSKQEELKTCFIVNYDKLIKGMEFEVGWNSVVLTTSAIASYKNSWNHRIFFDKNNDRWHLIYVDNSSDIHTTSSPDLTSWTDGVVIEAETFKYGTFDCALDYDDTTTYLHCAYTRTDEDFFNYRRCELGGITPFISCGTEEIPFDGSSMGQSLDDDVESVAIALDSNDCVLVLFDYEDDSVTTADEHQIVLTKEGNTCGDGDFDIADDEIGFPIYSIQSEDGYTAATAVGISSFGDLDMKLYWIDTDSATSADLETVFFDGDTDSIGTPDQLHGDIEYASAWSSYYSVIVSNSRSITFAMADNSENLTGFRTDTKDDLTDIETYIGIEMEYRISDGGLVTAVVDTVAEDADDIWVFSVNGLDDEDIYYAISTDGGVNWGSQTLWKDEASSEKVKFLSAFFDDENCDIVVTWVGGTTTPTDISIDSINTGNCGFDLNITNPTTDNQLSTSASTNITVTYDAQESGVNQTSNIATSNITIDGEMCTLASNIGCVGTLDCAAVATVNSCNNMTQCNWTSGDIGNTSGFQTWESDTVGWTLTNGDAGCDFIRDQDGTPSSSTGPQPQYSAPGAAGTDYYVFVEASGGQCDDGEQAYLNLNSDIDLNTYPNTLVSFYYSMYGATMGTLNVQVNTSGTWSTIWTLSGDQGDTPVWTQVNLTLSNFSDVLALRFEYDRDTSSGFTGDIALDHINVSQAVSVSGCGDNSPVGSCSSAGVDQCDNHSDASCSSGTVTEEAYSAGIGWQVNCTTSASCSGVGDLFLSVNFTDTNTIRNDTQTNAVDCGGGAADTCTYTSGDYEVTCDDNCTEATIDLDGNDFILTGSGSYKGNLTNYKNISITSTGSCLAWIST